VLAHQVTHILSYFFISDFILSISSINSMKNTFFPAFSQIFTNSFVFELFFHHKTTKACIKSKLSFSAVCLSKVALQISEFGTVSTFLYIFFIFSNNDKT